MATDCKLIGDPDIKGMDVIESAIVPETGAVTITLQRNGVPVMEASQRGCYVLLFVPYD